jgi:ribosomal protein L22
MAEEKKGAGRASSTGGSNKGAGRAGSTGGSQKDEAAKPKRAAAKSKDAKPAASKSKARKPAARAKASAKPEAKAKPETPQAESKSKPAARRKPAAKGAQAKAPAKPKAEAPGKAEKKAPAPKSRARRPDAAPARPVVRARAKYVRSSARKARLVMDHVRGRSVADARAVLLHTPRGVARDVARLLDSAVANAENNHDLVGDDLYVKEIYADEGPTLRRFRPRAQGRATRIRKRTSHLTVSLTTKE